MSNDGKRERDFTGERMKITHWLSAYPELLAEDTPLETVARQARAIYGASVRNIDIERAIDRVRRWQANHAPEEELPKREQSRPHRREYAYSRDEREVSIGSKRLWDRDLNDPRGHPERPLPMGGPLAPWNAAAIERAQAQKLAEATELRAEVNP